MTGISRTTYYNWIEADDDFAAACDIVQEECIDHVESKLIELIDGVTIEKVFKTGEKVIYTRPPDTKAVEFYLATIGKRRGYVKTKEVTGKDGGAIQIEQIVGMEVK